MQTMLYAVVTGATQGIGRAIAEKFLEKGFSVAVCARNRQDLSQLENEWTKKYPDRTILVAKADLGIREEVAGFGESILNKFPKVDVLVNNAGLFFPGQLATEPEGQLENLMAVNVFGAYHLTRQLLPRMKEQQSGHIFNLCSVASLKAYENGGAYSITKYAMQGFSDNLRHELMPDRLKVTALMPGATYTPSWQASGLPEERFMQAEDIARMVWAAYDLSATADVETIVIRPIAGDL